MDNDRESGNEIREDPKLDQLTSEIYDAASDELDFVMLVDRPSADASATDRLFLRLRASEGFREDATIALNRIRQALSKGDDEAAFEATFFAWKFLMVGWKCRGAVDDKQKMPEL